MKKGLLIGILFLFLLALQSLNFTFANELTNDYLDIAANYIDSSDYDRALEYINLILIFDPENIEAKKLKTKILPPISGLSPQKKSTAESESNKIISESAPSGLKEIVYNSDYYNNKGLEFCKKKDFDTALEYFYKSIKLNKRNYLAYNNLAMTYWSKNNIPSAIKYFKKSNFLNREYTQPLVNLSQLYKQIGDEQKQFYYLSKAIKYNSNDYLAYYWMGEYYRTQNKYPEAIQNYKEVVKINSKFSQVYLSLAISFFETEEFNYTLLALSQYQEFYPNADFAFFLRARANIAMCRYSDAKTDIQKAILISNNDKYQFELAKINYYLEDYNSALNILQNLAKSKDNAEYYNYIGLCYYKLKKLTPAMKNFNKTIQLDGLRPIYYYNLAQCYKSFEDKKNYSKYVNTAVKIIPINYQDFIDLSYIYQDNGNSNYAINILNNGITKYPDNKSLYLAKLKLYEVIGDNLHYNETKNLIEMRFNRR
jgi:tetratricopeptide (TPR) repeat protein